MLSGDEHVAEYRSPANVIPIAQGKKMADIEPNRHVLDELIQHALTQRIITRPVTVDELFARSTHGLVA